MEDDQQFCLRWNNHQSTLVSVFDTLLEKQTLVDCTLAAEGKCLNAHKVVLSACSPYFESLLCRHYDKHPILILKDVKFQELKAMMDYMYRGEVNISQDQLGALLKAAESLQIRGLSDGRKGETERKPAPPKSPEPQETTSVKQNATQLPKVSGLTIERSREGSQSPGLRKKKRMRRKSDDHTDNHDDHASNSSESHSLPAAAGNNAAAAQLSANSSSTQVPGDVAESKVEAVVGSGGRIKQQQQQDESSMSPQVPSLVKEKLEAAHTELMLEPKSEYMDDGNEDSIEDLTLDDDDMSNMDQMDDGAGPSHGNMEGGQGFGGWHMGNQSQDEVFLAAQEAVGAHRDSQDESKEDDAEDASGGAPAEEARATAPGMPVKIEMQEEDGDSEADVYKQSWLWLQNASEALDKPKKKWNRIKGHFVCPRCSRSYIRKDSLQRHLTYECGKEPQFQCPFCPQKCKRKAHQIRHIRRQHKDKIGILEENNPEFKLDKGILEESNLDAE